VVDEDWEYTPDPNDLPYQGSVDRESQSQDSNLEPSLYTDPPTNDHAPNQLAPDDPDARSSNRQAEGSITFVGLS
jgi:hypothetical protein